MSDLIVVFPAVKTSLQSVAMTDAQTASQGSEGGLFVLRNAVGAAGKAEALLSLGHDKREQTAVFLGLFGATAEEEGVESRWYQGYFLPWPWKSMTYLILRVLARLSRYCFIFIDSGARSCIVDSLPSKWTRTTVGSGPTLPCLFVSSRE